MSARRNQRFLQRTKFDIEGVLCFVCWPRKLVIRIIFLKNGIPPNWQVKRCSCTNTIPVIIFIRVAVVRVDSHIRLLSIDYRPWENLQQWQFQCVPDMFVNKIYFSYDPFESETENAVHRWRHIRIIFNSSLSCGSWILKGFQVTLLATFSRSRFVLFPFCENIFLLFKSVHKGFCRK